MDRKHTKYGWRWNCPVDGCTVVQWQGSTSTPADQETRTLRNQCHKAFDPMWKSGPVFARPNAGGRHARRITAYEWLAEKMGLAIDKMHFGMFNADQCREALGHIESLATKVEQSNKRECVA